MKRRDSSAAPSAEAGPPTDGRAASLAPDLERAVRALAASVEEQVRGLDDGSGAVRRRLVALLLDDTRRQATERLALRARRFVEQRGRCAACGQAFDARRRPVAPRADASLVCSPCDRQT